MSIFGTMHIILFHSSSVEVYAARSECDDAQRTLVALGTLVGSLMCEQMLSTKASVDNYSKTKKQSKTDVVRSREGDEFWDTQRHRAPSSVGSAPKERNRQHPSARVQARGGRTFASKEIASIPGAPPCVGVAEVEISAAKKGNVSTRALAYKRTPYVGVHGDWSLRPSGIFSGRREVEVWGKTASAHVRGARARKRGTYFRCENVAPRPLAQHRTASSRFWVSSAERERNGRQRPRAAVNGRSAHIRTAALRPSPSSSASIVGEVCRKESPEAEVCRKKEKASAPASTCRKNGPARRLCHRVAALTSAIHGVVSPAQRGTRMASMKQRLDSEEKKKEWWDGKRIEDGERRGRRAAEVPAPGNAEGGRGWDERQRVEEGGMKP
ncbi:hypothetical protein DFH09DRAFT_1101232 [Mycena vulgaris]|nr:hypothetical protein DFH09DRAFT_1101232 [Mycena vulgaris]